MIFDDEKDTVFASWEEAVYHTYSIISAFLSSSENTYVKYTEDASIKEMCHEDGVVCYATLYESLILDDIFNMEYNAYPIYIQYRNVGSTDINDLIVKWE